MALHRAPGRYAIAGLERAQNRLVVVDREQPQRRRVDAVDLEDPDLGLKTGEQRLQAAILRPLRQQPVKGAVDRQPVLPILLGALAAVGDLLARDRQILLGLVQIGVGEVRQGQAHRKAFQRSTNVVDLGDILAGKAGQEEAAPAFVAHDSILGQPVQRLAHRRSADAQVFAQPQVRELIARPKLAADNPLPNDRVHLVAKRRMVDLAHSFAN